MENNYASFFKKILKIQFSYILWKVKLVKTCPKNKFEGSLIPDENCGFQNVHKQLSHMMTLFGS